MDSTACRAHRHADEGRRAAEAGDWAGAGPAFVRAATDGSAEGAELVARLTVELVPPADGGSAEAGSPAGQRTYGTCGTDSPATP
ncbi:hypothetical protein ABZV75_25770 [Streptomyces flaveolus]|uniref:hypothetical protein n=1 Tax=Streptomyces flaveolus TaxID=67297 RepID=UPI0033B9F180